MLHYFLLSFVCIEIRFVVFFWSTAVKHMLNYIYNFVLWCNNNEQWSCNVDCVFIQYMVFYFSPIWVSIDGDDYMRI
jgi:hypothetical protein